MAAISLKLLIFTCSISLISSISEYLINDKNLNVLVPNNDINLQDKFKLVNNGKSDDDQRLLTESNLVDLAEILPKDKFIKVVQNYKNENHKVNDNQNKNNLANKLDLSDLLDKNTTKLDSDNTTKPLTNATSSQVSNSRNATVIETNSKSVDYDDGEENSSQLKVKSLISNKRECVLKTANHYLNWVTVNGTLNIKELNFSDKLYVDYSYKFKSQMQYESYVRSLDKAGNTNREKFKNLRMLSLAFNNLESLPNELFYLSNITLEYLTLIGNNLNFKKDEYLIDKKTENGSEEVCYYRIYKSFPRLERLKHLDLRNCNIKEIKDDLFIDLDNLKYLYLSENNIIDISARAFNNLNKLLHLDLSHNKIHVTTKLTISPQDPISEVLDGMRLKENQFEHLYNLRLLDLSFSKIEPKGFKALESLQPILTHLSLCYTDLPVLTESFFKNMFGLFVLDLSGNVRLSGNLDENTFRVFSNTLEVLYIRNSNIKQMSWTKPLKNLRVLNLNENSITALSNTSFMDMPKLEILDLGYNFIGNWYYRILIHDRKLKMINLRNNKINMLTKDMKKDLSNIDVIGLGRNEFECSCILHTFFNKAFDNTKAANGSDFEILSDSESSEESTNSQLRQEYNVLKRIYQKYRDLINKSSQELIKINFTKTKEDSSGRNSNSNKKYDLIQHRIFNEELIEENIISKLFDYTSDEYQCVNVTIKMKISIMQIFDKCEDKSNVVDETLENFLQDIGEQNSPLVTIVCSVVTVLILCVIIGVVYWKWWYIKYFCILFKNSTILSFLSDDQDLLGKNNGETTCEGGFIYDVFVSYCDENREWVLNDFLPEIEKRQQINVCLHERDFQVGYSILENIISCMDRSKVLLLVISENFLLSQWCQFEMHLAQHRLLETRRDKLILVLLEDINARKQSKTLKYLMKTKTYIKWPADEKDSEQKKLFWKRLKRAIIASNWEIDTSYGSIKSDAIKQ